MTNFPRQPEHIQLVEGYHYLKAPACALEGYIIKCDGPMTGGHIIHKGEVQGNAKAREILAACPPEIMTVQCYDHNISRWANTREAKKILLLQKIYEFGWDHIAEWFDVFLATFKVHPVELELERLLS